MTIKPNPKGAGVEELREKIGSILIDYDDGITTGAEANDKLLKLISDSNQQAVADAEMNTARKIASAAYEAGLVPKELTDPDDWKKEVQKAEAEVIAKIRGHQCPRHQLICACQLAILDSLSSTGGDTTYAVNMDPEGMVLNNSYTLPQDSSECSNCHCHHKGACEGYGVHPWHCIHCQPKDSKK